MIAPDVAPEPIFRIAQGFMAAKYLFAGNELGLFTALPDDGATLDALANATGVPSRTLRMVADALVTLGILTKEGSLYGHTAASRTYLSGRTPHDISAFLRFWDRLSYRGWTGFCDAVRADAVGIGGVTPTEEDLRVLLEGIEAITVSGARALGRAYDVGRHERLLDLGGGTGSFTIHLGREHPSLTGTLFDLNPALATTRIAEAGLAARFAVVEGDFFADPIPSGHDVILMSSVLHMHRPAQNRALLQRTRQHAQPGTRLLLLDYWTDATRTSPPFAALMAGEFLVVEGGDSYGVDEVREWLEQTGWRFDEHRPVDGASSLILAEAE